MFGHDIPDQYNITAYELLRVFGVTAIDALLEYAISRLVTNSREKTKRDQLITTASAH